jgi:hypothetical protein
MYVNVNNTNKISTDLITHVTISKYGVKTYSVLSILINGNERVQRESIINFDKYSCIEELYNILNNWVYIKQEYQDLYINPDNIILIYTSLDNEYICFKLRSDNSKNIIRILNTQENKNIVEGLTQMKHFIKLEKHIVNINKISNIKLTEKKTIINFAHTISLKEKRLIPDYLYTSKDIISEISKAGLLDNFITSKLTNEDTYFINKDHISNITVDSNNRRIVFNLDYSITMPNKANISSGDLITSDFVYLNFDYYDDFITEYDRISTDLLVS